MAPLGRRRCGRSWQLAAMMLGLVFPHQPGPQLCTHPSSLEQDDYEEGMAVDVDAGPALAV